MRRRRRTPTRTTQRKSSSGDALSFNSSTNKKSAAKRFFYLLFVIIILGGAGYYLYFQSPSEIKINDQKKVENTAEKITPVEEEIIAEPVYKPPKKKIQIEVLNGCGEKGVAKIFESYLRQQGFDVVNTDNYRYQGKIFWNVEFTNVVDQIGNEDYAAAVAQSLGIEDKHVTSFDNPSPICDVTVVIGKDFNQIKGFKEFSK